MYDNIYQTTALGFFNGTVATASTTNASPLLDFAANYWTGSASAQDLWTIGSVLAAGTNGTSVLTFTHTGTTGAAGVVFPNGTATIKAFGVSAHNGGFYYGPNSAGLIVGGDGGDIISFEVNAQSIIMAKQTLLGWCSLSGASGGLNAGGAGSAGIDTLLSRISAGVLGLGTAVATPASGQLNLATIQMTAAASPPTSAGTAGTAGEIIYNGALLYFCSVTGVAGSATWNKLSMTAV